MAWNALARRFRGIHRMTAMPLESHGPRYRPWRWFLLALVVVMLDQLSKRWVSDLIPYGTAIEIANYFNLVHVRNPGAAFSFLADAGGWQRHALSALALGVCAWLVRELMKGTHRRLECFAFAMIIGGALGNVIDRLRQGAVTDFLDFYWLSWHWPAFNLADVAINFGVVAMLLAAFQERTKLQHVVD